MLEIQLNILLLSKVICSLHCLVPIANKVPHIIFHFVSFALSCFQTSTTKFFVGGFYIREKVWIYFLNEYIIFKWVEVDFILFFGGV